MSESSIPLTRICTKCHREFPLTDEFFYKNKSYKHGLTSRCKGCLRAEVQKDRHDYPEKHSAREKARWQKDRDKRAALNLKWQRENRGKTREYRDRFKSAHPERLAKWTRDYDLSHPEQAKERQRNYTKRHPERAVIKVQRRRTNKKGLPNAFTANDWSRALDYFHHTCAVCGRPAGFWHKIVQDHWVALTDPRPDNPGTVPWNIVPLCHGDDGCNNSKRNRNAEEWLRSRYSAKEADAILARIAAYFDWIRAAS